MALSEATNKSVIIAITRAPPTHQPLTAAIMGCQWLVRGWGPGDGDDDGFVGGHHGVPLLQLGILSLVHAQRQTRVIDQHIDIGEPG
ncbi:hypothetical protein QWA_17815, partial [Alcaligenes faecalis subsp. faecalis NCIB 8687]